MATQAYGGLDAMSGMPMNDSPRGVLSCDQYPVPSIVAKYAKTDSSAWSDYGNIYQKCIFFPEV
eukprot:scaffold125613_cov52-Prasinocladus_malaysianus.AAC.1